MGHSGDGGRYWTGRWNDEIVIPRIENYHKTAKSVMNTNWNLRHHRAMILRTHSRLRMMEYYI